MRPPLRALVLFCSMGPPLATAFAARAQEIELPAPGPQQPAQRAIDPSAPPRTEIEIAPFLTFGTRLEFEYQFEKDFDLDSEHDDDKSKFKPGISVAFSYDPSPLFQAFLALDLRKQFEREAGSTTEDPTELSISQANITFKEVIDGLSLRLGRQRFRDEREWIYDEELDAGRLFYQYSRLALEFSASRSNLFDGDLLNDVDEDSVNYYYLGGSYALAEKATLRAYSFVRNDHSNNRGQQIFWGLHSSGEVLDDLEYWLELAHVRGRDGSRKIRGTGFDLGFAYKSDFPLKPAVALGYAFGSGDSNPDDQTDKNFRQTGLQDNSDRFNGVTRFRYYGEILDPELSNLHIFTAGIGFRPYRRNSFDAVFHYYRQDEPSTRRVRSSRIDARPAGRDKNLGSELDLIFGSRSIEDLDISVTLGYFMPGDAFGAGADDALFAEFKIRYNF